MALAHISLGKVAYWVGNAVSVALAAFGVIDPAIKVALIGLAGVALTNLTALIMVYLKLSHVEKKVDGNTDALQERLGARNDQLIEAAGQLAHEKGHREGSDEERARDKL
jgi:hypothetical protein